MALDRFGLGGSTKPPKKTVKKTSGKPKKSSEEEPAEDFFDQVSTSQPDEDLDFAAEDSSESESPADQSVSPVASKKKILKCMNAKCGYKRIVFKKTLEDTDLVCQKCQGKMKQVPK
jgi:hypothetical protein